MKKNLRDYVKIYNNWFDSEKCKVLVSDIEKCSWQQHTFYNVSDNSYGTRSGDKELDIAYSDSTLKPYVMQRIWDGYHRYTSELNFPWFNGWSGFTEVRFNRYAETRLMAEHCDHIHSLFDGQRKGIPTMTTLGLLNNDFEGGELVMFEDEIIQFKGGDLMVFPSVFLFPHRVEPVTKGVRYSCVSWAW